MKKSALLLLFFYLCSLAHVPQAKANPALAVLSAAAIGASLAPVLATGSTTKVSINLNDVYSYSAGSLYLPVLAYQTYQALGSNVAIGYATNVKVDVAAAYNQGLLAANSTLNAVIQSVWPPAAPQPIANQVVDSAHWGCTFGRVKITAVATQSSSWGIASGQFWSQCTGSIYEYYGDHSTSTTWYGYRYQYSYTTTTDATTWPPPAAPTTLTNPSDIQTLAQALSNAATADPNAKSALDNVIAQNPALAASPSSISKADVDAYARQAVGDALQDKIDALQALVAANPTDASLQAQLADALAQQAAQAAQDVQDQAAEETFSPVDASGFDTAYTPGEFDIPARFTTFLHNVKSSGLFSFSSSFFNSLPSGGSPTLTIEGGQTFGTHTFDFSQALGGGLAILKSVLLACFGFLSIRAVIMKR